jgi:hypothetical protein
MDCALKTNANAIQTGKAKTVRRHHVRASTTAQATESASAKTYANAIPVGWTIPVPHPTAANSTAATKTEFAKLPMFANVTTASSALIVLN